MYGQKRTLVSKRTTESGHLTKQQIKQLKQTGAFEVKPEGTMQFLYATWSALINSLRPSTTYRRKIDCQIEGHVMRTRKWKVGEHPRCGECGTRIEDPGSLRRPL